MSFVAPVEGAVWNLIKVTLLESVSFGCEGQGQVYLYSTFKNNRGWPKCSTILAMKYRKYNIKTEKYDI